jgi:hypothetical protein
MWKRFWTVALAFIFIVSLASIVDAQMRRPNDRRSPNANNNNNGNQGENPGNQGDNPGNQGENPGNQGENPGNQGDNPGDQGENPGDQGENPGNQGENPGDGTPGGGTPDGETPAEEDVCDELKYGATKGLYGLCVAFCEAQDSECVPDYGAEDPYAGCEMRDRRILENYNRKKKDGDPDMPCLPSAGEDPEYACPCWGQDQLQYFPFYLQPYDVAETYFSFGVDEDQSYWDEDEDTGEMTLVCEQTGSYLQETSILSTGEPFYFDLYVTQGDCDGMLCGGAIGCYGESCPSDLPSYGYFSLGITAEEYENCRMSIEQLTAY